MRSGRCWEGKALCKDPLVCSLPAAGTLLHLIQDDNLIFFGDLLNIFVFLKTSRHWPIANEFTWKIAHSVDTAHSVLTLTTGTTGLKWQSCCYFLPHLHCLHEAVDAHRTVHKLQRNIWIMPLSLVGVFSVYSYHIFSPVPWSNEQGLFAANPRINPHRCVHTLTLMALLQCCVEFLLNSK